MVALLKLWKLALGLIVGLAVGWLVMVPSARESGRSAGYRAGHTAGVSEERIAHEEARRRAEAKADADRRAAQVRIDAIERAYHERTAEQAAQLDVLEASIAQESARVPTPSAADRGAPACRPAVPRGLRDALDPIGRAAPRNDPPGAPAALR